MISIPGSKSYTNRALILGALTKGNVTLENPLYSEDTHAMISCLRTLGLKIETEPHRLLIQDDISCIKEGMYPLFVQDSGTTARFLLALSCIIPGVKSIEGYRRLNERPISDLVSALRDLGAKITYTEKEGTFPVQITSSELTGSSVQLDGNISSQFCSALLLISPLLKQGLKIDLHPPLISKSYIDMTCGMMKEWGAHVEKEETIFFSPHQTYQKRHFVIEGDYSSAAYFFAIGALNQSTVQVENLNPHSVQPDRKFLSILEQMGNEIHYREKGVQIVGKGVTPLTVNMEECPDQVMTLAVLAAFAKGTTHISGVRSLRVKETERVIALKRELKKIGIETEDTHDTLTIHGATPHAAQIETYNDHRMAMTFAIAMIRLPEMTLLHPEVVNKTVPNFWELLRSLQ